MKRILIAFSVLMAAASCSKKDTLITVDKTDSIPAADTVQTPDSVSLITRAYMYDRTVTDTNAAYVTMDSIYYNSDLKIEKIITTFTEADPAISQYTYNSHGDIATLDVSSVSGNLFFNFNVQFFYDSENRLDSMVRTYTDEVIIYTFSYDASNHIKHTSSYYLKSIETTRPDGSINTEETYYRNSNGGIDSIYTGLYSNSESDQFYDMKLTTIPTGNIVVAADAIPQAYLLKLIWQRSSYFQDQYVNIFWNQFFNPDISMLRDGTCNFSDYYSSINFTGYNYGVNAVMNVDNTVRWISSSQVNYNGNTRNLGMTKLEYTKVVKP